MSSKRKTSDNLDSIRTHTLKVGRTLFESVATSNQTLTLQDVSGTLAVTDDIPTSLVTLDTPQTFTGLKTFDAGPQVGDTTLSSLASIPRSVAFPNASGTLALTSDIPSNSVTTDTTQTISALKTFSTGPKIGNTTFTSIATGSKTITLPDVTDTIVGVTATQTLSNKTLENPSIGALGDVSKKLLFNFTGATNLSSTFSIPNNNQTYTFPAGNQSLVGTSTTQTLSNKTLQSLKVSTTGSTMVGMQFGQLSLSGLTVNASSNTVIGNIPIVNFTIVGRMQLTLKTPSTGGTQNWDKIHISYDGANSTTTNIVVLGTNTTGSNITTTGTAILDWIAYG